MDYAYQTDNAVNELLKFKVSFSETYNTYMFNNTWVNEIDEHYYSVKIENIKILLHKQLKYGLKQSEYLQNLLDSIWAKIEYIEKYKYYSSEFLELYSEKISSVEYYDKLPTSNSDLFEKYKTNSKSVSTNESELFNFLSIHSEKMNGFQNLLDFEKGLLLYVLSTYKEVLRDLHGFIYTIHMNEEYIDFKNLDFEEYSPNKKEDRICHVNFDKKDVALLFSVLLEEKIFVFDESNIGKNRLEMKRFVEENFTYRNAKKERLYIKTFNREYSEAISVNSSETKKQKEFLDRLIFKLQNRRNNTKD